MIYAIFQQEISRISSKDTIVKIVHNPRPFSNIANTLCPATQVLGFYAHKDIHYDPDVEMLFEGRDNLIAINAKNNTTAESCITTLWHEEAHLHQYKHYKRFNEFRAQYYSLRKSYQLSKELNLSQPLRNAMKNTKGWLDLEDAVYVHAAQNLRLTRLWNCCEKFLKTLKAKKLRLFNAPQIEQIRNAYHRGTTIASLSCTWGCSPGTIRNIVQYKTYKDVIMTELGYG